MQSASTIARAEGGATGQTAAARDAASTLSLDTVRELHTEMRTRGAEIESARRLPDDLAGRMARAGMFRLLVPAALGGFEVHPREFFDALAATAEADGAVGWVQMIGTTTGILSASLPPAWAEEIYGAHPDCISTGVTAPLGKARPVPGGYVVNGRWPFGSGSQVSDWICGGCVLLDESGEPRRNARGIPETVLALFPAQDVIIHDTWDTSGLCGTGSHDIEVVDAFVPDGRWSVLGGRARVDAPLYRFPTLGLLALGVSAVAIGIARHAIRAFTELATDKIPTGSARALADRGSTQRDLARATAMVDAAVALTHAAIDRAWQAATTSDRLTIETKAELRMAATHNTWSAAAAVDLLYHAAGGSAIYTKSPLQRCFRDIHVATQHLMVAQPTWEAVGKVLLGMDPKTLL
jgi:alkylation response protein AidB-like acyl-CoA dehydrogenase